MFPIHFYKSILNRRMLVNVHSAFFCDWEGSQLYQNEIKIFFILLHEMFI